MLAKKIAVCGLGYVGLPVAVAFGRCFDVVAFDVDARRIESLKRGDDWTCEVPSDVLAGSRVHFTNDIEDCGECDFFIVAVPTPVDDNRSPDFSQLRRACQLIGPILRPGCIVVFESTVHPGATEDICGPELEKSSGLVCGVDFKLGYSPERINPGDRDHPLEKIVKIVSAQDEQALDIVSRVYARIIDAGVFSASSIKVAEAAKVLENTQRDINIALMNEMSKICDLVGIRTAEVLEAAGTKWNFLPFTPGLVGGHCIGVDPYYLTSKAQQLGYHPEVILAGRRINDGMADHVASRLVQILARGQRLASSVRVGILGITFKENVPDIRNSKVVDLCRSLGRYGMTPLVHDPIADPVQTRREYGIELSELADFRELDALILAVPHRQLVDQIHDRLSDMVVAGGIIGDLKSALDPALIRPGLTYWAL